MPSLGAPELILILVIVLVVFGAGKLPQIGQQLGRSIREFRTSSEGQETPPDPGATTTLDNTTATPPPAEQKKSGL